MSGPIVRKYGFPNFEKIFGERPLEHGVDDASNSEEAGGSEEKKADSQRSPGSAPESTAPDESPKR
jgi:hypothetical protein